MKTVKDLEKIGFKNIGYWFIDLKNKLQYKINDNLNLTESHLLYSFESNSIVKYIGITEQTLKERLSNYKNGYNKTSGSTNKKVYSKIFKTLENGFTVNIWLLKDDAPCTFKGYEISLATGIEKSLIKDFNLKENLWNSRGTKITSNSKSVQILNNSYTLNIKNYETILKLGKFAREGWLVFKKDDELYLPYESTHMNIIYKNIVIEGCRFTRSFNNKKINGGYELIKIFENDFKKENFVKVIILSNNEVKIEKI